MGRRSGRLLACLLVLGLVSACQTPAVAPERFALEAAQSPSLVVRVTQPRRVQAVVGDVDHLLVTVKAADGAEPTRRIEVSEFSGSDASVTFDSLASGEATVEVRALSGTSQVLGQASVQATVTPGVLTEVAVPLQLAPVYSQQPVTPQAPGDVALSIPVTDGFFFPTIPAMGRWGQEVPYAPLVEPTTIGPDHLIEGFNQYDYFYVVPDSRGGLLYNAGTVVMNVLANDTVVEIPTHSVGAASDGQNYVWVLRPNSEAIHRHAIASPGAPLSVVLPDQPVAYAVQVDAQDYAWVSNGHSVSKVAPDGSVIGHFDVGGAAGRLAVHQPSGEVWVIVDQTSLVRLAADGTELGRTSAGLLPGDVLADVAVDEQGQVWVPQPHGRRVVKLGPDGAVRQAFSMFYLPEAVACDGAGNTYVSTVRSIIRIAADGTLAEFEGGHWSSEISGDTYWTQRNPARLSVASDGSVWHVFKHPTDWGHYRTQIKP